MVDQPLIACLSVALITGIVAGFCTHFIVQHLGGPDPDASALIGVFGFIGAFAFMVRVIWPRPNKVTGRNQASGLTPARTPVAPPNPFEEPQVLERDLAVRAAWNRALDLAPGDKVRLRRARAYCAQLLKLAQDNVMDAAIIDCAALVSHNVPVLVDSVAALWEDADQTERIELAADLVSDLERLAERSQFEVGRHRKTLRDRLHVIRTHIANRTGAKGHL
jgi:hypothetical protein